MCSADLAIPGYRSRESGGADYELQNKNHRLTYERGHLHLYLSSSPHHPGCTGIFYVRSRKSSEHFKKDRFQIYPRHLSYFHTVKNNSFDLEVAVDADRIRSIHLANLSESTSAMFPLVEPVLDSLASQIYSTQSLENLDYASDQKYTAQMLIHAIEETVQKAASS